MISRQFNLFPLGNLRCRESWVLVENKDNHKPMVRTGREHWAWLVVVEVRQGTLCGWSWLRSGREHLAWMVVVEVRQGTLGVDARG